MRKIIVVLFAAVLFSGCWDTPVSPGIPVEPPEPPAPPDPAFWFGDIYAELAEREEAETMGQIANVQYVTDAINRRWGADTITPAPGTATEIANTEYLLRAIDRANRGITNFVQAVSHAANR